MKSYSADQKSGLGILVAVACPDARSFGAIFTLVPLVSPEFLLTNQQGFVYLIQKLARLFHILLTLAFAPFRLSISF